MDVKRGPILFRCDGTQEDGWEPLYQCLSLAAALQRRRRGTHFFSYLDPLSLAQVVTRGNNDWVPAEQRLGDARDLAATVREARRLNASAVIVAGGGDEYVREVRRATGALVMSLDPAAGDGGAADLLVSPFLAPARKAFRPGPGCQLLAGRKFALVRGLFRRQRTIRATEQPAPFRALVALGDDDSDGTLLRTQQLLDTANVDRVSMVVRYHHPRYEELKEFAADSGGRAEVVTEPKELMTRLVRGHFALTGGDTGSLETACVGLPQLLLPGTPKHLANAKRMDDEGMATLLGPADGVTVEQLREAVGILLDDPMERLTMSRCARNLVDGRGGDRIVNGMEIMLHTPSRAVPALAAAA
jgi:spore coat polysaccharide biosynthesis predicted glycosyltransferase SpsG